ncbi:MAG TPA: hypothetical protein VGB85_14000, partial [Nannocystis sp.]
GAAVTLPSEDRERLLDTLRRVDPGEFRAQVRAVLAAYGDVTGSARALRIAAPTLARWIASDPSLAAGLDLEP